VLTLLTSSPLHYRAQQILDSHLQAAGISMAKVRVVDASSPDWTRRVAGATLIVAMGAAAATAATLEPFKPKDVEMKRGYLYEGVKGLKVLVTVDPDLIDTSWVPWSALFKYDLERAKREAQFPEIRRPVREVIVV
jgi:hypothetical protein